jgi:AmmeMemoRadiSam system protein B
LRDLPYRSSNFSGSFYPKKKSELKKFLDFCFKESSFGPQQSTENLNKKNKKKVYGLIVPHGAYKFSGAISAHAFFEINFQHIDTFILIGPDHRGIGKRISIMSEGVWQTPFGEVLINDKIAQAIKKNNNIITDDQLVHQFEHSLEILIPFLQYSRSNDFTIVPLLIKEQNIKTSITLGNLLAKSLSGTNAIIIASSNLTHYDLNANAYKKDLTLIKSIEKLDIELFYQTIINDNISICGYGAIASLMRTVQLLGSKLGSLLKYATSGDVTSDYKNTVVAYASIAFV